MRVLRGVVDDVAISKRTAPSDSAGRHQIYVRPNSILACQVVIIRSLVILHQKAATFHICRLVR